MNWLTGNEKAKQIEKLQSDSRRIKNKIKDALLDFKPGNQVDLLKLAQEAQNFNVRVRDYKSNDKTYDNSLWDHLRIDGNTIDRIIKLSISQIASGKRRKSSKRRKASSKKHKRKMTNRRKKRQTKKSRKKLGGGDAKSRAKAGVLNPESIYVTLPQCKRGMLNYWTRDDWLIHFGATIDKGHPPNNKEGIKFYTECSKHLSEDSKTYMKEAYSAVTDEVFPEQLV